MKIAVDAMGGDNAPDEVIKGAVKAINEIEADILLVGNENVILCERGIRTFETETRNTLDIQAVPVIKELSHLPIIIDPSHAGGMSYLVEAGAKSGIVAGADGLMIEVHNDPANAWSDGEQCLTPDEFARLMEKARKLAEFEGRSIDEAATILTK